MPVDRIKKTITYTTQFTPASVNPLPMHKHYKSHSPAYNAHRWNKSVATDTVSATLLLMMMASWASVAPLWPNSMLARPV